MRNPMADARRQMGLPGWRPDDKKDWAAILGSKPEDRRKIDRETRRFFPLTDASELTSKERRPSVYIRYSLMRLAGSWLRISTRPHGTKMRWHSSQCAENWESSRSGNGGHVWIFFETAISAILARKIGCAVLTQTMDRRHHLGLDSYDHFSPN